MKKYIAIVTLLAISGCTSPKTVLPADTLQPSPAATLTTSPVPITTQPPTSTSTLVPSETPTTSLPTQTLIPPIPTLLNASTDVSMSGTSLPAAVEPISKENYDRLTLAAQWGNGSILDTAFAPDGSFFIVRSYSGIAIYDPLNLESAPRWIEFPDRVYNQMMEVSMDGRFLLLTYVPLRDATDIQGQQVFELSTRVISSDPSAHEWYEPAYRNADRLVDIVAVSPDGKHQLRTGIRTTLPGNPPDALREMTDPQDGSLYYELADPLPDVQLGEYMRPAGCDVQYFTPGASVPELMAPVQVEFASNSKSFAILYYAAAYNGWKEIRIYNTLDGQLLTTLGSNELPVVDFAYVPGQETLLVAYEDGSINLWDIRQNRTMWQRQDFQPYSEFALVSSDGKSALLNSKFGLEVRSLADGSLQGHYDPTALAASPVQNMMALGHENGNIEIRDISNGEMIHIFMGHQAEIYGLAFSPDGQSLVSSSYDCTVRLWDMQAKQYVRSFEVPTVSWNGKESRMHAWNLVFIPGTDTLLGFGTWHYMVKWDISTGEQLEVIEQAAEVREYQFVIGQNQFFYVVNHDYYLDTGTLSGTFSPPAGFPGDCSPYGPETLDGKLRFTVGTESLSGYICVVSIPDEQVIAFLVVRRVGSLIPVYPGKLFITPDGTQLIGVSSVIYVFQLDQK